MNIVEVKTLSDLLDLEEQWTDLLKHCDHSIFSTFEWISIWWKHFGYNKRLLVLLAEEEGKIVGIAPLMYSVYSVCGLRQRRIEFIGTPYSDYNDFLILRGKEDCLSLFLGHVKNFNQKWDSIELNDISENSQTISTLKGLSVAVTPSGKCPSIPLATSYEAFLSSLSYNLRANLRRNSKRLKQSFKIEFLDCSDVQFCDYGMNWLFDLHQKRWEQLGRKGLFSDLKFRDFHLEISRSFAKKGWLGLFLLRLSGKPAAAAYGFKYKNKFYFYLQGLDPSYLRYSVGNQVTAYAAKKCIDDQVVEFDFMRGADAYKDRWTASPKWNFRAVIPRNKYLFYFQNSFYKKYVLAVAALQCHLTRSKMS